MVPGGQKWRFLVKNGVMGGHRVEQKNVANQKPISYNIFIYKMDIWICPRFFQIWPPIGQKWRFSVKKWRFWGGVKNVKNQYFSSLSSLYFQKFEKAMYPHFFVFGPLVVKNGVFRYWPPIFGGQNFFANQKPISYNIFIYKMDIWICPRFFQIWPPSCQKWRFSVKKWRFWGGVKNVKNQFFFLSISLFSKVRESNVPTVFSFLAP